MSQLETCTFPAYSRARSLFGTLLPRSADKTRFVWLNNFEAERFWAPPGVVQLPNVSSPQDSAIVNRMEEMALFLAESPDFLILREPSDPGFLDYVSSLGFQVPTILPVQPHDVTTALSPAILDTAEFQRTLSTLPPDICLLSFAKTRYEEKIAQTNNLGEVGPSVEVCEKVNSKIYGRKAARELGLTTIPGCECTSLAELETSFARLSAQVPTATKIVLKESMGVSGKGLLLVESKAKFQRVVELLKRRAKPEAQYAFVLEEWIDKERDINYQIFISPSGKVELLAIKEILTEGGVHMGHRFPTPLTEAQHGTYLDAAEAIGKRLYEDGYFGIAGIDSIIDTSGKVYPLLEINARFNMSTFHLTLEERIVGNSAAWARYYPLLLREKVDFEQLVGALGKNCYSPATRQGAIILNFATVNANFPRKGAEGAKGRLYVMITGADFDQVRKIDSAIATQLQTLTIPN